MIFVTTGTQKFQFNRLLKAIDTEIEQGHIKEEVFAQSGASDYLPVHYRYQDFLSMQQMADVRKKADLIITHGGTNSIIEGLRLGIPVIAVARLAKYQEHVDDHQTEIIQEMSEEGLITGVADLSNLNQAILAARKKSPPIYKSNNKQLLQYLEQICREVENG